MLQFSYSTYNQGVNKPCSEFTKTFQMSNVWNFIRFLFSDICFLDVVHGVLIYWINQPTWWEHYKQVSSYFHILCHVCIPLSMVPSLKPSWRLPCDDVVYTKAYEWLLLWGAWRQLSPKAPLTNMPIGPLDHSEIDWFMTSNMNHPCGVGLGGKA